jgi:hypothetical protein
MAEDNSVSTRMFTSRLFVRCPSVLPLAVERAAINQCMTPSEYIRRSVFERLKADGIDPASMAGAA